MARPYRIRQIPGREDWRVVSSQGDISTRGIHSRRVSCLQESSASGGLRRYNHARSGNRIRASQWLAPTEFVRFRGAKIGELFQVRATYLRAASILAGCPDFRNHQRVVNHEDTISPIRGIGCGRASGSPLQNSSDSGARRLASCFKSGRHTCARHPFSQGVLSSGIISEWWITKIQSCPFGESDAGEQVARPYRIRQIPGREDWRVVSNQGEFKAMRLPWVKPWAGKPPVTSSAFARRQANGDNRFIRNCSRQS